MKTILIIVISAAALMVLWLFMIAPRIIRRPKIDYFRKFYYAHRGLYNNEAGVPENSIAAFKKAVEHGYGIEMDLQITKYNFIVIHHDNNIKRMCGKNLFINKSNLSEIKQYRLLDTGESIPTLEQALEVIDGKVPVIFEYKAYASYKKLCIKAHEILSAYKGRYMTESFHPFAVRAIRKLDPKIAAGQLMCSFRGNESGIRGRAAAWALRNLLCNFLARPDFIAYKVEDGVNLSFYLSMKLFKAVRVAWTVNDESTFKKLKRENAMIIFENFMP